MKISYKTAAFQPVGNIEGSHIQLQETLGEMAEDGYKLVGVVDSRNCQFLVFMREESEGPLSLNG